MGGEAGDRVVREDGRDVTRGDRGDVARGDRTDVVADRGNVGREDGSDVVRCDRRNIDRFLFPFSNLEKLKISPSVLNPVLVGEHIGVEIHRDGVDQFVPGGLDHLVRLTGGQGGWRQVEKPPDAPGSSSEYLPGMARSEPRERLDGLSPGSGHVETGQAGLG